MTGGDRQAFARCMGRLGAAYREDVTVEILDVYFEALSDYELEYLEPAVAYVIRTSKWFPKPVELREAASQYRVEARRKALGPGLRLALTERALTADEVKAFLAELRARPECADALAEIPQKGVAALHDDVRRLEAIGARDMTDEKRAALAQYQRYQGGCSERSEAGRRREGHDADPFTTHPC